MNNKEFDLAKRPVVILSTDSGRTFTYKVLNIDWETSNVEVVDEAGNTNHLHFDFIAQFGGVYYKDETPAPAPNDDDKPINLDDIPF